MTHNQLTWYELTFHSVMQDAEGKEVRLMKGVMRVGDLAKGLLLSNNLNIELVVLCSEKPTQSLLNKIYSMLPDKIKVGVVSTRRCRRNWL